MIKAQEGLVPQGLLSVTLEKHDEASEALTEMPQEEPVTTHMCLDLALQWCKPC